MNKPKWYHYIAAFFAGFFLLNAVPHLEHGISGDPFPSPFANPPGKGLSSAMTNTLWGLLNLIIGYVLYRASKLQTKHIGLVIVFFVAVVLCALMLTNNFVHKDSL